VTAEWPGIELANCRSL